MPNNYNGNPLQNNRTSGQPPSAGGQFVVAVPVDSDPNNCATMFNAAYPDIADTLQFLLDGYGVIYDGYTTVRGIFIDGVGGQSIPNPPTSISNSIFFNSNGTSTGGQLYFQPSSKDMILSSYDSTATDGLVFTSNKNIQLNLGTTTSGTINILFAHTSQTFTVTGTGGNVLTIDNSGDLTVAENIISTTGGVTAHLDILSNHILGKNSSGSTTIVGHFGPIGTPTLTGTDSNGQIKITSASSTVVAANGPLFDVTFAHAYLNVPTVIVEPISNAALSASGVLSLDLAAYYDCFVTNVSTTGFTYGVGSIGGISDSGPVGGALFYDAYSFQWNYMVMGF